MYNKKNKIIDSYILDGIIKITNYNDRKIIHIIKDLDLPYDILNKYYNYIVFKKELFSNNEMVSVFNNKKISLSPYLQDDNIYYFFGVIGLCHIFGLNEAKKEIPFYDYMINDIHDLLDITNDNNENLYNFIHFNKIHQDYNSSIKNTLFVFTYAFKDNIINFENYLNDYLKK